MISKSAINDFVKEMLAAGYILYDTFGFIAGTDFPYDVEKTDTLSKFWYKADAGNGTTPDIQTFTPWLASHLEDPMKLVVDITVDLGSGEEELIHIVRS